MCYAVIENEYSSQLFHNINDPPILFFLIYIAGFWYELKYFVEKNAIKIYFSCSISILICHSILKVIGQKFTFLL